MTDLKDLLKTSAKKERDFYTIGVWVLATFSVIGTFILILPLFTPKPAPIVEAPVKEKSAFDSVRLSAEAAIVYDLATGEVIYEKNAEAQLPLASLTKLLTLYAASEVLSPESQVTITANALAQEGDAGFTEGEVFTFQEIAELALVASSNDAAAAIAEAAADAKHAANDSALLASAIHALGLSQTYALNGTGLDENGRVSGAYGSAKDIAILAGELLKRAPSIARASIESSVNASSLAGHSYNLKNTNPGVERVSGLMLSKTGFTDLAGGNLAIVFDAGINHPIAVVVLGSTKDQRFVDVDTLVKATTADFAGLTLPL